MQIELYYRPDIQGRGDVIRLAPGAVDADANANATGGVAGGPGAECGPVFALEKKARF